MVSTSTPSNSTEVREAVQRMANRRAALLEKLRSMVDEVAEVYTKLGRREDAAKLGAAPR